MRDKGAFVWIVVDACHSGTMTRGIEDEDVRSRRVDPISLGVPPERLAAAQAARTTRGSSGSPSHRVAPWEIAREAGEGQVVAFFAAQPDQLAKEARLPIRQPGRRPHGLLTFFLAQALSQYPDATYRELASVILAGYDRFGPQAATPLFEGALDRPILGSAGATFRGWPVERLDKSTLHMSAGSLHGLTEGDTVELLRIDEEQVVARARVSDVGLSESALVLSELIGVERLPSHLYGKVLAKQFSLALTVAEPSGPRATEQELRHVRDALRRLIDQEEHVALVALTTVPASESADVYLRVEDGSIWLLGAEGDWDRASDDEGAKRTRFPYVALAANPQQTAISLEESLRRLARVKNLLEIAAALNASPLGENLQITAAVLRDQENDAAARSTPPDNRPCSSTPPRDLIPPDAETFSLEETPELFHCDIVYVGVENSGQLPIDVTVLYVDGTACIGVPRMVEHGVRLEPGGPPQVISLRLATWNSKRNEPLSTGLERLLIIGVERAQEADRASLAEFSHLAQDCLAVRQPPPPATRDATTGALRALLDDAVFGDGTVRAAMRGTEDAIDRAVIHVVRWQTSPPRVAP
jgi:hypothetical protein